MLIRKQWWSPGVATSSPTPSVCVTAPQQVWHLNRNNHRYRSWFCLEKTYLGPNLCSQTTPPHNFITSFPSTLLIGSHSESIHEIKKVSIYLEWLELYFPCIWDWEYVCGGSWYLRHWDHDHSKFEIKWRSMRALFHFTVSVLPPPPTDVPLPSSHTTDIVLSSYHPEQLLEILADAFKVKGHHVRKVESGSGLVKMSRSLFIFFLSSQDLNWSPWPTTGSRHWVFISGRFFALFFVFFAESDLENETQTWQTFWKLKPIKWHTRINISSSNECPVVGSVLSTSVELCRSLAGKMWSPVRCEWLALTSSDA